MHPLSYDYEEPIEKRFEDLCQDLCIEGAIREEAWEKYKDVWANYSIDGDQVQWLVCSLYECCRRSLSDSLSGHVIDNSYVSLSRLLSAAKMSMVQFFHRIRKWADMTDMLDDMRDRIELLERQFAVSSVIFRNFGRSFGVLFSDADYDASQMHPTSTDLFKFTWLLFIKSRSNFPAVTDDLVNSYHLLACCLDWILGAVMVSRRRDLINMEQNGLPREFVSAVAQGKNWCPTHDEPPCMLRPICEDNDVNYVECKTVKEHFFRPFVMRLIEKDLIKLHPSVFGSLLEPENFDITVQNLMNNYEEYIIGTGDFDERIYLSPNAAEEIGSIGESGFNSDSHLSIGLTPSARRYMLEVSSSGFGGFTETTRRGNVNAGAISRLNGGVNFNNPEARNQNLNQLQILLAGRTKEPSEALVDLLEAHCSTSLFRSMCDRLDELGKQFQHNYAGTKTANPITNLLDSSNVNNVAISAAQQRLQLGYPFYYMILENILLDEIRRIEKRLNQCGNDTTATIINDSTIISTAAAATTTTTTTPSTTASNNISNNAANQTRRIKADLTTLMNQEIFHRALFACCMEIVLLSCDPPDHHFPWILDALNLDAIHFFKVVEVVVRNLDFPRDIVKYMNQVVEHILDCYAWRSSSPLWSILKANGRAPSIEEVIPPEKLDQGFTANFDRNVDRKSLNTGNLVSVNSIKQSPSSLLKQSNTTLSGNRAPIRNFPLAQTPRHRLLSGVEDESAQAAAQLLASDSGDTESTPLDSALIPGTTEEVATEHGTSNIDIKPLRQMSDNFSVTTTESSSWPSKNASLNYFPTRHDSIAIFFRQVYQVASLRLRDLCERLNLNGDLLAKTWTCVEQVIVHETELLRDRCLDQVLMCCLYGVCKIGLYRPLTFVDIVQVYRMQPQSNRDIYRRVLINRVSYGRGNTEDRGDLSQFYNVVFLPLMKEFVKKAASVRSNSAEPDAGVRSVSGDAISGDPNALLHHWTPHPSLSPMPLQVNTLASSNAIGSIGIGAGNTNTSNDVAQARRLASNRNIFISPVKQQVNLSPKKVVFTIGRSIGKDLQDINVMISSAERRTSMANLTMGLKRPGSTTTTYVNNSPAFTVNSGTSSSRTVTLVGPSGFTTKRIDFDI